MKTFFSLGAAFFLLFVSPDGHAFHCTVSTTPVSFGNYDVFAATALDTTGTVALYCNNPEQKPMPVRVSISSGASGSFNPRQMRFAGGIERMSYYLFIDPSRTVIWGDGTGGTSAFATTIDKTGPLNATIYGRVPARQNLRAGAYGDNLVVTVMW